MVGIDIRFIPHSRQRYETVGDWLVAADGTIRIFVSRMSNPRHEFLVAAHEVIESFMCIYVCGINVKDIDSFDKKYEADRLRGKYRSDQEPGDDPDAPYRLPHFIATTVERVLATFLGVDWGKYASEVESL